MVDSENLLAWVTETFPATELPRLQATLQEWCEINSGSDNLEGLATMQACLTDSFGALSEIQRSIPLESYTRYDQRGDRVKQALGEVMRFKKRPDAPIQVLFNGHYDTVYSADDEFQKCSLLNENEMQGPGVTDMKGGLLIMREAIALFESFDSKVRDRIGWEVVLNPDEEIGTPGSRGILKDAVDGKDFGLVYECSTPDGGLVHRRLGTGAFMARVKGRSAHAGRDITEGRNAIEGLSAFILALKEIAHRKALSAIINVGSVYSDFPLNTVPDEAVAQFNIRCGDHENYKALQTAIQIEKERLEKEHEIEIEWIGDLNRLPREPDDRVLEMEKAVENCLEALGDDFHWRDTGGGTDGSLLLGYGLPNIDSLGARGDGLHSHRERIFLPSLIERSRLTALFLLKIAQGEIDFRKFSSQS